MNPRIMTMVDNSTPRLWIKASPHGTRSGFAVLPDGAGGRVTVTVLPKPWSLNGQIVRQYDHEAGSTTHVVMYETELIALSTTAVVAGSLAMSLMKVARDEAELLTLGRALGGPLSSPSVSGDPFRELINLVLLAERGSVTSSLLEFEGGFAPSLLRLLMHERLLSAVEELIFRVRPRYAERTENLAMPRGRLSESSLLYSLMTGTPRVESTFDELTTDTLLLQVVASALRVIGSDRLPHRITELRPGLQTRAVQLLRHLSGVTLIDREQALLAAERLWLGPLDQIWKPAIDAVVPVLRDWAIEPESGDESAEAVVVHISTEKFWEQCVEMALRSAFKTIAVSRNAQAGEGMSVPVPWSTQIPGGHKRSKEANSSFPDFMFRLGKKVVVADAKYKLGTGNTPSSSDGYQLFAYSHLARYEGKPSDMAVLLYPTRGNNRSHQMKLERLRGRDYCLWIVRVPFPSPLDLKGQGNWGRYIARLSAVLRDLATQWKPQTSALKSPTAVLGPS